ncbi:hypothetical protein VTK56DRAFT_8478 [Thermocarpiscus australiensis]
MSRHLGPDALAEPETITANGRRLWLVSVFRRKTSRLFGNKAIDTADNHFRSVVSLRNRPTWFDSVRIRLYRRDRPGIETNHFSPDAEFDFFEDPAGTASTASATETSSSGSPARRRVFSTPDFVLRSLPWRSRRQEVVVREEVSTSSDSSLGVGTKENVSALTMLSGRNMGSYSSFRLGVRRALRDMVDSNFTFSEEPRAPRIASPQPRAPLGTLWTIPPAASSESVMILAIPSPKVTRTDVLLSDRGESSHAVSPYPESPVSPQSSHPGRPPTPAVSVIEESTAGSERLAGSSVYSESTCGEENTPPVLQDGLDDLRLQENRHETNWTGNEEISEFETESEGELSVEDMPLRMLKDRLGRFDHITLAPFV